MLLEGKKKWKISFPRAILVRLSALWERGDACFRFRKYLNDAWDRYRAASYETSCSRIYVCPTRTRRLSVVPLGREAEVVPYISYRRSNTGLSVDPRGTRLNPPAAFKIRTEEERSFRASHRRLCRRGRSSDILRTNLISRVPPVARDVRKRRAATTANDIESRRGTSCESSVADRHDLPSERCVFVAIQYDDDLSKNRVVATIGQLSTRNFIRACRVIFREIVAREEERMSK